VGVGDPLEAAIDLVAPIPAGTWHLVGDGVVIEPVDVRFDVLWRPKSGAPDVTLATWFHHFDPDPTGMFNAVPFEADSLGVAADAHDGDQLVLRFSATGATISMAYIPNGDGAHTNGRDPSLTLPR
jgi:hypothetical protein